LKEKSTVIKKIVDRYLVKALGYDLQTQLFFDENVYGLGGKVRGYTDIEIQLDGKKTDIIIEAKRNGKKLLEKDRKQTIEYGRSKNVKIVVLANGNDYELYNSVSGNRITLNNRLLDGIPRCVDLPLFLGSFSQDHVELTTSNIPFNLRTILKPCLGNDIFKIETKKSMADLETIFKHCHDILRDGEHFNPEKSFEEFSKLLFLKLYSEKLHNGKLPDTKLKPDEISTFKEISEQPKPLTVKILVLRNFDRITKAYDEVFDNTDVFRIKRAETFKELVDVLSQVNFDLEIDADVKGRAYEHFLATILKGSKLGQFFTPRPIVKMMVRLVNPKPGDIILDPACGSGGFLIKVMQVIDWHINENPHEREESKEQRHRKIRRNNLFGSDAGVVVKTAKMNMILAGDGHTNIIHGNALTEEIEFLRMDQEPIFDIIITNPPFGLKEKLTKKQLDKYDLPVSKAQSLFIQLMIRKAKPNGIICTVVDEGVLNTSTYTDLRKHILRKCFVLGVFSLPVATFKPHYSGVKASVLLLCRKENELIRQNFPIFGYDLQYVGYNNVGRPINNDDIPQALEEWNRHVSKYSSECNV
jgi:type I restriction enzyme M protein